MPEYRVRVDNIRCWFTDVEARNEDEARHLALVKASNWKGLNGIPLNPNPTTSTVHEVWEKEQKS